MASCRPEAGRKPARCIGLFAAVERGGNELGLPINVPEQRANVGPSEDDWHGLGPPRFQDFLAFAGMVEP